MYRETPDGLAKLALRVPEDLEGLILHLNVKTDVPVSKICRTIIKDFFIGDKNRLLSRDASYKKFKQLMDKE